MIGKAKKMWVFDCQEMPEEVRKQFFNNSSASNDTYVCWFMYPENEYCETVKEFEKLNVNESDIVWKEIEDGHVYWNARGKDIVSDWLLDNGIKVHEEVIIKHWW